MAALKYWLWLSTRTGVGNSMVQRVLAHFGSPEHAFYADPKEYDQLNYLTEKQKKTFLEKDLVHVDKILSDCDTLRQEIITMQDATYPLRLLQMDEPPILLYTKGRFPHIDDEVAISIVGAREATSYGIRFAGEIALELARNGAMIVSGIAQGIDTAAIQGALKGGGQVISVLAGGIDVVYPKENLYLYEDVAAVGALVSEHPPGTRPKGENFPFRNRIISGLSLGVLAAECKMRSGTMTTIARAIEQNRDIFALAGNVDAPMSRGPNYLIQQGAKLVTCAEDILEEYRQIYPHKLKRKQPLDLDSVNQRIPAEKPHRGDSPENKKAVKEKQEKRPTVSLEQQKKDFTDDQIMVLFAVQDSMHTADEIVEQTQIPMRRVSTALTLLQVQGYIEECAGRKFRALAELEPS